LSEIPLLFFEIMVFTRFSGRTDSQTHSQTDRPENRMLPAPAPKVSVAEHRNIGVHDVYKNGFHNANLWLLPLACKKGEGQLRNAGSRLPVTCSCNYGNKIQVS